MIRKLILALAIVIGSLVAPVPVSEPEPADAHHLVLPVVHCRNGRPSIYSWVVSWAEVVVLEGRYYAGCKAYFRNDPRWTCWYTVRYSDHYLSKYTCNI